MALTTYPPTGIKRWVFRAPVWIFRAHFGFVFGHRMVYLVTRGRRSGVRRETVLEATRYNQTAGLVVVISGWGERADWYRNLLSAPALEIRIGGRRYSKPPHRLLDTDQIALLLEDYRRARPWSWRSFGSSMGLPRDPARSQLDDAASRLRAVAFAIPSDNRAVWHYPQ
jgi:deazaflavin-dependent oxidoreductase (nitroreductase family)